jgi:hypothetical protein
MLTVKLRSKRCRCCKAQFTPARPMQVACGPICALEVIRVKRAKDERAADRAKREKMKPLRKIMAEAQAVFNAFIRERDRDQPCICCGRTTTSVDGLGAHGWDAGHYRSTGSASGLRFDEDNCHRQLVLCNRHGAGRAVDYRIGLIARIGIARVEALEASNEVHKWTKDELRAIKATYAAKLRELKSRGEPAKGGLLVVEVT